MNINPKVVDIYRLDTVTSFDKARAFGIRGVIQKRTEGMNTDREIKVYDDRRHRALDAGMVCGAYHFLRPGNMVEQAHRFIDLAAPSEATLVALDHEDPRVHLSDARVFLEAIIEDIGRKAVLYSGFLIKEQLVKVSADDVAFFGGHRLWLSHYSATPLWPRCWVAPWLWQFTGDALGPNLPRSVPGMQDRIDINSYAGTDDDLVKEWAS